MRRGARDGTWEINGGQVLAPADRRSAVRIWLPAWAGCAALGMTNGILRQAVYTKPLGERQAHQLSTAILLPALAGYTYLLDRRHPLPDRATALGVGATWAAFTGIFEIGLGRLSGLSWSQILADYDVSAGRIWPLVPVTMAVAPVLVEGRRRHLAGARLEPARSPRNR